MTTTGAIRDGLARLLAIEEPAREADVVAVKPITGGYSRDTHVATVTWADAGPQEYVLRADPPPGHGVFVSDRSAEWRLLQALHVANSVLTPVPRWYDSTGEYLGTPTIVMDRFPGRSLQDALGTDISVSDGVDRFARTFAGIHATPLAALPAHLTRPADPDGYLEQVIAVYDRVSVDYPDCAPVVTHVAAWLRRNRPPAVALGLVHGDCQPSNVLLAADGRALVIDWEFARIGDPREDLGYYTQVPMTPHAYNDDPERFLSAYCAASGLPADAVTPAIVDYFLMIGIAALFRQLLDAAACVARGERRGALAPYLINAISHLQTTFLATTERTGKDAS